jgi:hypothetical protein
MDILTQYYSQGGQIVRKTPDLSTREFYRDVLFRHRFKEMFVADNERNQAGWYNTDTGIYLDFSAGQSSNSTLWPNTNTMTNMNVEFSTTPTDVSTAGEYTPVEGYNGRNAVRPVPFTDSNGSTIQTFFLTNTCPLPASSSLRLRLIARSPSLATEYHDSDFGSIQACIGYSGKSFFLGPGMKVYSFGTYGSLSVDGYEGGSSFGDFSSEAKGMTTDDTWHVYDLLLNNNSPSQFLIDGEVVGVQQSGIYFPGVLSQPYLALYMATGAEEVNYSIDSLSLEVI